MHSLFAELRELSDSLEDSEGYLKKQVKKIESAQANADKTKKIFDKMVQLDTMEEEINLCVAKTYWFEYKVAGDTLALVKEDLHKKQQAWEKAKKDYERASGNDNSQQEEIATISNELEELNKTLEEVEQEAAQRHNQYKDSQRRFNATKQSVEEVRRGKQDLNRRLNQVHQQIQELRKKALESAQAGEVELVRAIARLER